LEKSRPPVSQADRRHDHAVDQALDDAVEGRADDHADGQVDDVAARDELAEFLDDAHDCASSDSCDDGEADGVRPPGSSGLARRRRDYSSAFRRPRSSLPLLKNGTCLARTSTVSPVRGLRPERAGRERTDRAPKPRSSTRPPSSSADHALKDHADNALDVLLGQVRIFVREPGDEFGLDHRYPRRRGRNWRDRTFAQGWLSLQEAYCDSISGPFWRAHNLSLAR
jgi:hypothetical protein